MKNLTNFCIASSILVFAALGLLAESCKKSAPPQQPAAKTEKSVEPTKPEPTKTDANTSKLVPLNFILPNKVIEGTRQDIRGYENLEQPTGELRPAFHAPEGTINVSAGKSATSNQESIIGELALITDGDKEAADGSFVEFGPGITYVTIDLGAEYNIYAILVWHYHKQQQAYLGVIVQVSDDPNFTNNVKTLFNSDIENKAGQGFGKDKYYVDTYEGRLFDAKGVKGRYVRLYSNGNTTNEMNHYTEVEVYGKPVK